jgi:hypothetical protein
MAQFDLYGGVGIMGFISPMDTEDTYAVIDPIYGIDGLRNVPTINDLNEISFDRRRPGMIVGVEGGQIYYRLKDVEWVGDITDWIELDLNKVFFIDKETPTGVIDGINSIFYLSHEPIPNSDHLYLNGLLQDSGVSEDYIISGNTITFNESPLLGMKIRCSYRTI